MVELVFVIIVLGIVSSIAAEIIANVYEQYLLQRAEYRASTKTELAALQIANRLTYAIPGTIVRRLSKSGATEDITAPLTLDPTGDTYTVLQWVGYDADSFQAISCAATTATCRRPGWSGFCDLNASAGTTLSTPGSNLTLASTIIGNLGGNINNAAVYFAGYATENNISSVSGNTITLSAAPSVKVEQYKLAWSSYALVIENGDLYLYHHFSPVPAVNIPAASTTTRSLLLKNINTFKFKGDGNTIRFKICKTENIGEDFNVSSCKEKAVF